MPSERLMRILIAKSPYTPAQIETMTEAEGWRWVYEHAKPAREKTTTICFTGFGQNERDELEALATGVHLHVVGSVTKSLSLLCAGEYAGPMKLAKAKEQGIPVVTRDQFMNLVKTGEMPMRATYAGCQ